jgi:hypothetical protein
MKQKDIALIITIAFFSAIISFFVSGKLFVTPSNRQQKVEVVDAINTQFTQPDKKYFNSTSVDPTQPISLGNNDNQDPFNGNSQ